LVDDMTHAALTPLLGREFDNFLFAPIGDDQKGSPLSVVSALARLDVDPWKEALSLARMPKASAASRLTSLIASLPKGATTGLTPEAIAAHLVALLPQATGLKAPVPVALLKVAPARRSPLFLGLGVLALVVVGYVIFTARATNAPGGGIDDAPAATSEPAARR
jgi:hypothetical protein